MMEVMRILFHIIICWGRKDCETMEKKGRSLDQKREKPETAVDICRISGSGADQLYGRADHRFEGDAVCGGNQSD